MENNFKSKYAAVKIKSGEDFFVEITKLYRTPNIKSFTTMMDFINLLVNDIIYDYNIDMIKLHIEMAYNDENYEFLHMIKVYCDSNHTNVDENFI